MIAIWLRAQRRRAAGGAGGAGRWKAWKVWKPAGLGRMEAMDKRDGGKDRGVGKVKHGRLDKGKGCDKRKKDRH